jgi:hypothetical protein
MIEFTFVLRKNVLLFKGLQRQLINDPGGQPEDPDKSINLE